MLLHTLFAGLVGTLLMSTVMVFIHRAGWANADMIRAVGSLVTRSYHDALIPGLSLHFIAGALFAIPYALILNATGMTAPLALTVIGAALGLFHGAAMSFVLLALVAERHPLTQFRDAGFEVAAAHLVGHVAYGFGVGGTCALLAGV